MNILPKKRWHVRTKDNIARVRRDEAAAREEEQKRLAKLEFAESEARINFLRNKSGLPDRPKETPKEEDTLTTSISNTSETHVDLFSDYKSHIKQTNKELEKEKKEEQEKYEKQIGYLTYLGQDTNEALKLRSWYEVAPKRAQVGELDVEENDLKNKHKHDPLFLINTLLPPDKAQTVSNNRHQFPPKAEILSVESKKPISKHEKELHKSKKQKKEKKHKKHRKSSKEKDRHKKKKKGRKKDSTYEAEIERKNLMLEKLRKERLKREASERLRQELLFAPLEEKTGTEDNEKTTTSNTPRIVQKYNSQFNPEFAKQNMM